MLLYFHSNNLLFAKHGPILTSYSFPVFIVIVVSFRSLFVCQFIDGSWSTRQRVAGGQPTGDTLSRKRAPTNELTMLAGQPMEMKNSKKQALAKELTTLADELLKGSWKNGKGPTVPTRGTLIATYVRLKTEFEEIVAVEKQYSPGKVMAPIEDEEMAPEGMGSTGELHKVKNNGLLP